MISIPYGRQDINDEDIDAVEAVLRSDWLTQGPAVEKFEDVVRFYCGASHAVAVNSATSALHLACRALDLGPGDILWTSPNTFVASANAALYCGAGIDFVDIDPRTYNMSVDALAQKLEEREKSGKLPKVVMPVHFAGQSCDMAEIGRLAVRYGFSIIEDASHAIGGQRDGEPVGNCAYSLITVFSFHPVKIITTGEGGMAVTNDAGLADRMRLLRSHGVTRNPEWMVGETHGPWYYEQVDLGYNYRMTDMQAALGASQMKRIDEFVAKRHQIAGRYDELLSSLPVVLPWQHPASRSAYHLYPIRIDRDHTSSSRSAAFAALRENGIGVNVHYIPVHTQPHFRALGFNGGDFPRAEAYYADAISIPLHPRMGEDDQMRVVDVLRRVLA